MRRFTDGDSSRWDILVLHDMSGEFRKLPEETLKSTLKQQSKNDNMWIIWQMFSPRPKDDSWDISRLWSIIKEQGLLKRTILVLKAECMRRAGANLPENTSLEEESARFEEA